MKIKLGFGTTEQEVELPQKNILNILTPGQVEYALTGEEEVKRALEHPIGSPRLREIVKPGEKIAIVTSDITRSMPSWTVMPPLLDELYAAGAKPEDITLIFALGSHRTHTEEEKKSWRANAHMRKYAVKTAILWTVYIWAGLYMEPP